MRFSHPKFEDEFSLASIFSHYNWRPQDNVARCTAKKEAHFVPGRTCSCGFYASYSSSIIYHPEMLEKKDYCFGAVRMYGEDLPMCQNGLRASGANVAGLLFSPASLEMATVQNLLERLVKEDIFFTSSAEEFIKHFPDQNYKDIIGFDPVERIGDLQVRSYEYRPFTGGSDDWRKVDYDLKFCRLVRPEMLQREELPNESTETNTAFAVSLKPEYRPGGSLYRHPLIEAWES